MSLSRPPRKWAKPDYKFGKDAETDWHSANTRDEEIELAAAKIQHDMVLRTRVKMVPRNLTQQTLGQASGISDSVLGKVIRGDRPLLLTHLAALERVLGNLRNSGP